MIDVKVFREALKIAFDENYAEGVMAANKIPDLMNKKFKSEYSFAGIDIENGWVSMQYLTWDGSTHYYADIVFKPNGYEIKEL